MEGSTYNVSVAAPPMRAPSPEDLIQDVIRIREERRNWEKAGMVINDRLDNAEKAVAAAIEFLQRGLQNGDYQTKGDGRL